MSRPVKTLRRPFQAVADCSAFTAKTVNCGVDSIMSAHASVHKSVITNKYVKMAGTSIKGLTKGVKGKKRDGASGPSADASLDSTLLEKVAPYTSAAQPYVQPVVPFIEKAKPYLPPAVLAVVLLCTPPVLCLMGFVAFITAPIWLTVGFFTAFIWIPAVISAFFATLFLTFVAAVRHLSMPAGQAFLKKIWRQMTSTKMAQRIFYVTI